MNISDTKDEEGTIQCGFRVPSWKNSSASNEWNESHEGESVLSRISDPLIWLFSSETVLFLNLPKVLIPPPITQGLLF